MVIAMGSAQARGHKGHRGHHSHHEKATHVAKHTGGRGHHSHHNTAPVIFDSGPCSGLKSLAQQSGDPVAWHRYRACVAKQSGY